MNADCCLHAAALSLPDLRKVRAGFASRGQPPTTAPDAKHQRREAQSDCSIGYRRDAAEH